MTSRVAIYARVSSDQQAERQTIDAQLHACREYCRRHGYAVVVEFRDEGVSGAMPFDERPEGKRLLMLASDGLFERVVVYCPDRLARDVVEAGLAMRELKRLKVATDLVSQSFDDTPEGEALFNMLMLFAQYERRVIARRTHAGRERVVRQGRYISGPVVPTATAGATTGGRLSLTPSRLLWCSRCSAGPQIPASRPSPLGLMRCASRRPTLGGAGDAWAAGAG